MKILFKILIVVIIGVATNEMGFSTVPLTTIITQTADNLKTDVMKNEIWKDIAGYEGYYQVSNFGRVKSLQRTVITGKYSCPVVLKERILTVSKNKHGYGYVMLASNGTSKSFAVHRLVIKSFILNPENKPQVNHIDGIKTHNELENLEWATNSENQLHAHKTGLKTSSFAGIFGIDHPRSRKIIQLGIDGLEIDTYYSSVEASQKTGICYGSINNCARGVAKTGGGFIWKYAS